ncbi:MAG: transcription antitermination factor NusB [Bacteroidota bacterium]
MLSRRHLRIRVMQALYAYYQSDNKDMLQTEQELLRGTNKIFELYLLTLQMILELANQEELYYADQPVSAVTGTKKSVERKLGENIFVAWLQNNASFSRQVKDHKISWQNEMDAVRKSFFQIRQSDQYKDYSKTVEASTKSDVEFITWIFTEVFTRQEFVFSTLEEKSIYWAESIDLIQSMITKTLEGSKSKGEFKLLNLFKDEEDDVKFMRDLVKKTIQDDEYLTQLISEKTKNWEADRIAMVDIILMKMALTEMLHLSSIPVKVSINEYIDISKDYSTPNSKSFINGVIDKLAVELKSQGKIVKIGRGLME